MNRKELYDKFKDVQEYYAFLEEQFDRTLKKIIDNRLLENKKVRVEAIIRNSFDGFDHKDNLRELLRKYEVQSSR